MDDRKMRVQVDEALARLELRQRQRLGRGLKAAGGGAAAGLMLALDACVKIIDDQPQPLYGVQVDGATVDAADAAMLDVVVLYGVPDTGASDAVDLEAAVLYGIADAGVDAASASDAAGLELTVLYGIADAGVGEDATVEDATVEDATVEDATVEDAASED